MEASLTFAKHSLDVVEWDCPLDNPDYNIPHPTAFGVSVAFTYQSSPKLTYTTLKWLERKTHLIKECKKRKRCHTDGSWRAKVSGPQIHAALQIMSRFDTYAQNAEGNQYRCGILLGDQMGCGKTRVIALVIAETSLLTPEKKIKVLWLTAKKELQVDAQNELNEIDCNVPFITVESAHDAPKGIVFAAYSSLSRKKDLNKLFGIAKWLDDECLMIFDESHLCMNETNCSKAVKWLQWKFPKARVLYVTATVGTESTHMAYMERLGLWGKEAPFRNIVDFTSNDAKFGLLGLELISNYLTTQGSFISRQLFVKDIFYSRKVVKLTDDQKRVTEMSVIVWQSLLKYVELLVEEDKMKYLECLKLEEAGKQSSIARTHRSNQFKRTRYYWGAHQRFFNSLILSFKAPAVKDLRREYTTDEYSYVISVMYTGYSSWMRSKTKKIVEYSSCREILLQALNFFEIDTDAKHIKEPVNGTKKSLKDLVKSFYSVVKNDLPGCPINQIHKDFGGSQEVAEITGRKCMQERRLVNVQQTLSSDEDDSDEDDSDDSDEDDSDEDDSDEDDSDEDDSVEDDTDKETKCIYVNKTMHLDIVEEAQKFQKGEKNTIIISQRGGMGLSLHADSNIPNIKKRVHVILQFPWVPQQALQQIGRTNRANQKYSPVYVLVTTDIPGELRFFQTYYERLNKMGALSQGSRTGSSSMKEDCPNILSEFPTIANDAAHNVINKIENSEDMSIADLKKDLQNVHLRTGSQQINSVQQKPEKLTLQRVLNRILGLKIAQQELIIERITNEYKRLIKDHLEKGKLDTGMKELTDGWKLKQIDEICYNSKSSNLCCKLLTLCVDKGILFEDLLKGLGETTIRNGQFFIQNKLIAFGVPNKFGRSWVNEPTNEVMSYDICTPWKSNMTELSHTALIKYKKVKFAQPADVHRIKTIWNEMFKLGNAMNICEHNYKLPSAEEPEIGEFKCSVCSSSNPFRPRKTILTVISGCLLFVLKTVLDTFAKGSGKNTAKARPQILRLNVNSENSAMKKMIGIAIPTQFVSAVQEALKNLFREKTPEEEKKLAKADASAKLTELSKFQYIIDEWNKQQQQPAHEKQPHQPVDEKLRHQPVDEQLRHQPEDEKQHQPVDEKLRHQPEDEKQQHQPVDEKQRHQPVDEQQLNELTEKNPIYDRVHDGLKLTIRRNTKDDPQFSERLQCSYGECSNARETFLDTDLQLSDEESGSDD